MFRLKFIFMFEGHGLPARVDSCLQSRKQREARIMFIYSNLISEHVQKALQPSPEPLVNEMMDVKAWYKIQRSWRVQNCPLSLTTMWGQLAYMWQVCHEQDWQAHMAKDAQQCLPEVGNLFRRNTDTHTHTQQGTPSLLRTKRLNNNTVGTQHNSVADGNPFVSLNYIRACCKKAKDNRWFSWVVWKTAFVKLQA